MVERSGGGDTVVERVRPLVERVARRHDCEPYEIRYVQETGNWILRVVIDKEDGVTIEDCAQVSRELSRLLDVEDDDLIPHRYTLEVSSPGLDRELRGEEDYRRFAGERVRVQTREPIRGRRVVHGVLRGIQDDAVRLEDDTGESIEIPVARIREARLEVEI